MLLYVMQIYKVLYNNCYGGFGFSDEFAVELEVRIGEPVGHAFKHYRYRDHPEAVKLFLEKGSEWSSGSCSKLECVGIPDYLKDYYTIHEYDGQENVVINFSLAIEDATEKYLENPTLETLQLLRDTIDKIKSSRNEWYKD